MGRGTQQDYRLGLGATWEPDLWGRIRRTIENAKASAQASAADLANARLSAQMELAADYIQMRELDEEKRLLDLTVTAYARSLTITQNKYKVGVAQESDVLSAQALLQGTQAQAVDLIQQRARMEHAIAILTGQPPADLTRRPAAWSLKLPLLPAGVPSELLQRRPDVAASERQAAAANALIGVQIAAYYPDLTLTGSPGFEAAANWVACSAPRPSPGAFARPRPRPCMPTSAPARLQVGPRRGRRYDEAVANYWQAVLTALGHGRGQSRRPARARRRTGAQ